MKPNLISSLLIASAALSLCACESTKKQFDFSKKAPDEFAVVRRAPLEMPPDFNTLPAPKPGAPRPQEESPVNQAKTAILGEDATNRVATENGVSQGEAVLLQRTGAANASPAIRRAVDVETDKIAKEEEPGIDKLKGLVGMDTDRDASAKVVDPVAEINRLRQTGAQAGQQGSGQPAQSTKE